MHLSDEREPKVAKNGEEEAQQTDEDEDERREKVEELSSNSRLRSKREKTKAVASGA